MTFDMRALVLEQQKNALAFEDNVRVTKAYTIGVDYDDSSAKADVPGYSWIREYGVNGAISWALNPYVSDRVDVPVLVKKSPKPPFTRLILGVDWDTVINLPDFDGTDMMLQEHGNSHEWPDFAPGSDVVSIHPRAIASLRTTIGTLDQALTISAYRYVRGDAVSIYPGIVNDDISAYFPTTSNQLMLLVYLDPNTNTIHYAQGEEVPELDTFTPPFPSFPAGMVYSAVVTLHSSTTDMVEADILDMRQIVHAEGSQFTATRVGELLMSMDGEEFTPQLPLVDTENGNILIDLEDGTIVVEG